jgi:hypothetical protein
LAGGRDNKGNNPITFLRENELDGNFSSGMTFIQLIIHDCRISIVKELILVFLNQRFDTRVDPSSDNKEDLFMKEPLDQIIIIKISIPQYPNNSFVSD